MGFLMSEDDETKEFYEAMSARDWQRVRTMLETGTVSEREHGPALHAAVKDGDIHTVEWLLDKGTIRRTDFWKARNEAAMLGQNAVLRRIERTVTNMAEAERAQMNRHSLTDSRIRAKRNKKRVAV